MNYILSFVIGFIFGFLFIGQNLILAIGATIFVNLVRKKFQNDQKWIRFFSGLLIGAAIRIVFFIIQILLRLL